MCNYCTNKDNKKPIIDADHGEVFGKNVSSFVTVDGNSLVVGWCFGEIFEFGTPIAYCPMCGKKLLE